MKKRQNYQTKLISGTNITLKEFEKLLFKKFKTYPLSRTNYRKNQYEMHNAFYHDGTSVTYNQIKTFCKKLGANYEEGYTNWAYSKGIIIDLK
jgi:hypothetical protein